MLRLGVGALVHGLLDTIVDGHFDTILDDAIEGLEDQLFDEHGQTHAVQVRTYRLRKELVELRRVVLPMRDVVNAVLRHGELAERHTELDGFYDDLYDHVLRAWVDRALRDMITTIFETNLSLQDARLNTVMKKLTGWAAIIAVPTAVTGWFGQNVPYPGFGQPGRPAQHGRHRRGRRTALRRLPPQGLDLRPRARRPRPKPGPSRWMDQSNRG